MIISLSNSFLQLRSIPSLSRQQLWNSSSTWWLLELVLSLLGVACCAGVATPFCWGSVWISQAVPAFISLGAGRIKPDFDYVDVGAIIPVSFLAGEPLSSSDPSTARSFKAHRYCSYPIAFPCPSMVVLAGEATSSYCLMEVVQVSHDWQAVLIVRWCEVISCYWGHPSQDKH